MSRVPQSLVALLIFSWANLPVKDGYIALVRKRCGEETQSAWPSGAAHALEGRPAWIFYGRRATNQSVMLCLETRQDGHGRSKLS
jgi:hypothetical protein